MIIFFGPPGAGKSVQGQILAAKHGWRWLSSGQLLRDSKNTEVLKEMQSGRLVGEDYIHQILKDALSRAGAIERLVLDGFPRELGQAKWLLGILPTHNRAVELAVVLEVPVDELKKRLSVRGRPDDQEEVIDDRLAIYHQETQPVLDFMANQGIKIAKVNGVGTIGEVHDRIESELKKL